MLEVFGIYIPVAFRLYKNFETMSDETYEITLGYPQYRHSLTQLLRQSQMKEMERFMPESLLSSVNNSENGALPKEALKNVMEILEN